MHKYIQYNVLVNRKQWPWLQPRGHQQITEETRWVSQFNSAYFSIKTFLSCSIAFYSTLQAGVEKTRFALLKLWKHCRADEHILAECVEWGKNKDWTKNVYTYLHKNKPQFSIKVRNTCSYLWTMYSTQGTYSYLPNYSMLCATHFLFSNIFDDIVQHPQVQHCVRDTKRLWTGLKKQQQLYCVIFTSSSGFYFCNAQRVRKNVWPVEKLSLFSGILLLLWDVFVIVQC